MQHAVVLTVAQFVAIEAAELLRSLADVGHSAFLDVPYSTSWSDLGRTHALFDQIMEHDMDHGYGHSALLDVHPPVWTVVERRPSIFDRRGMWQRPNPIRRHADWMIRQPSRVRRRINRQVQEMMQQQQAASAPFPYAYVHERASTKCGNSTQSMMCSSELSGGKQTDVHSENGKVFVNGHLVHEGLPADPVSVRTRNGAVYVNDARVWPKEAAVEGSVNRTQESLLRSGQPDHAVGEENLVANLALSGCDSVSGFLSHVSDVVRCLSGESLNQNRTNLPGEPLRHGILNLSGESLNHGILAASRPAVVSLSFLTATSLVLFVCMHGRKRHTDDCQPLLK